jgi:hypothetical protein
MHQLPHGTCTINVLTVRRTLVYADPMNPDLANFEC